MAKDMNLTAQEIYEKEFHVDLKGYAPEPGLVVVLSIVTCGIYLLYYLWKAGKMVSSLTRSNGHHPSDDSIVLMVLSILQLSLVSYCILQSHINGFAKD